jgi:hypothetical protein
MISLAALLILSSTPTPTPQDAGYALEPLAQLGYVNAEPPRLQPEQVVLTYYRTRVHVSTLTTALGNIYPMQIRVPDEVHGGEGSTTTLTRFVGVDSNLLLIRDSSESAREIIVTARKLEDLLDPQEPVSDPAPRSPIVQFEYRPRSLSTEVALRALAPYQRTIQLPPTADSFGAWRKADSIHALPERNLIVIRELADQLSEIRAYLARIDVPAPQVNLTCWIVRGKPTGESSKALPQELVANLAKLVPSPAFELSASSMVRGSTIEPLTMESTVTDRSGSYKLRLLPSAYDEQTSELSFSSIAFEYSVVGTVSNPPSTSSFQGAATLRPGEYTVLGSVGEAPLMVVLRIQPAR